MLDLLDSKARSRVQQSIREQVRAGALRQATIAIEELVAQSQDDRLVEAAYKSAEESVWIGSGCRAACSHPPASMPSPKRSERWAIS